MRAVSLDLHRICRGYKGLVRGAYLQSHSSLTPPRCARLRGQRSTRNLKGSIFIRLQMRRKGIKTTGLPCQTLSSVLLASPGQAFFISTRFAPVPARTSVVSGQSVSVRLDLGGRLKIKKKTK